MSDAEELSPRARELILETDNTVLVSTASLWEIAIKQRKGKLCGCDDYLSRYAVWHDRWGFGTLVVKPEHAILAGSLRFQHGDPFDRMLIAQSRETGASIVTVDKKIQALHPNTVW